MPESTIESEQADGNKGDKAVRIASGLASHHLQPPASPTTETCNNDEDCLSEDSGHGEPNATKPQNEQEESRTKLQQSSPLSSAALGIPTTKRAETPKRFSPTPSPSVSFTSYAEAEIPESMSELSAEEDNPPSSPVRSFFYPSKQSPLQTIETGPIENLNGGWKATDDRGPGRRRVQSNMNGQTQVSPIPKIPLRPSRGTPKLDSSREKETFEDEHDVSDVLSPRHVTSPPSSRDPSTLVSPGSSINDSSNVDYATQERQDKALVEKFWTAYDEILILSIFTQVGILCRLGAAYFFQNFSDVFHSDSALFTNLPLNCLSCFVMGLLCSGESLMQIIGTRFTPPRLQRDLHRETILQCQETTLDDGESPYDQRIVDDDEEMIEMTTIETERKGWRRRRKRRRAKRKTNRNRRRNNRLSNLSQQHQNKHAQNPDIYNELREVQLLAWERRIRASICLLLFPVKKEEVDIVETYFSEGYERERNFYGGEEKTEESGTVLSPKFENQTSGCDAVFSDSGNTDMGGFDDLIFEEEIDHSPRKPPPRKLPDKTPEMKSTGKKRNQHIATDTMNGLSRENRDTPEQGRMHARGNVHISARQYGQLEGGNIVDYGTHENPDLDQIISNVATNVATGVSNNISMIGRVNFANGWDVGTSPQEKSEDLTLGLRDGLCGALSSFSSWISSMVNLFRAGEIGQGLVGLVLGIQLPMVAYRFGQHVSVYIFVWRCRREKGRDERRGYGIQVQTLDEEAPTDDLIGSPRSFRAGSFDSADVSSAGHSQRMTRTKGRRTVHDEENDVPSIRAIFTALFIMCLVAQLTSLTFFKKTEDRLLALSLLFSPLGVLARWRMMKFNSWRPSFPLGTFACNITACALSGTLGTLLAGNPGPRERIALVSVIAGFGGTLSSVARFIVEILSLVDPILFRFDGFYYAIASLGVGLLVSFLFAASVDWADSIE